MSQQAFEPQQNERPGYNAEVEAQPYYRPKKTGNMPKNEHPSTFEESVSAIPPYSYRAQDNTSQGAFQAQQASTKKQQRQHKNFKYTFYNSDGDAFEHGYRPYERKQWSSYNRQAPYWARPQRNPVTRILFLLVLGFVLLKVIVPLLIGAGILVLAGVTLFVLLPILIVLGIVVFFSIISVAVMALLGIPVRRIFWRSRWHGSL